MKPQLRHYDTAIPIERQPHCPECGGYMHLNRMQNEMHSHLEGVLVQWYCTDQGCPGAILVDEYAVPRGTYIDTDEQFNLILEKLKGERS